MSVQFGANEVADGTRVTVSASLDGPPPPDMIAPLTRPFEITAVRGFAQTGVVTVRAELPPGVDPDSVVMLVDEGNGQWRPLDTVYDGVSQSASARWPHFSRGIVGWFDPVFDARDAIVDTAADAANSAARWTGEQYDRAKDWTVERAKNIAGKVSEGLLAAVGGTMDRVQCEPSGSDWKFTGTGSGPDLLTGCTKPFESGGSFWDMRIGDRAPYPMLITLPTGMTGPGALDSFSSMDLEDAAASMLWSLDDRAVVPSGKSIDVRTYRAIGRTARVDGIIDVSTLAIRALALIAVYFSRGESAAVRKELKDVVSETAKKLADQRKDGLTTYTLAEFARDLGTDSKLSRDIRSANASRSAGVVDTGFAILSLLTCGISEAKNGLGKMSLSNALDQLADACFQPFAKASIQITSGEILSRADPATQAKANAKLLKGALEEILNVRKLVTASVAAQLDAATLRAAGLTQGGLSLQCSSPECADTIVDGPTLATLGICRAPCKITGKVDIQHPSWGPTTLVTSQASYPTSSAPKTYESHIVAIDAAGAVRWHHDAGEWLSLALADPAIDRTGNIFLNYDPGRYNGVIILKPTPEGFQDFATLPPPGDFSQRFYSARLIDDDRDGTYEISSEVNTCTPSCAAANYDLAVFRWNGRDYVTS